MHKGLLFVSLLVGLPGCQSSSVPKPDSPPETVAAVEEPVEPSWESQLAEVRAGKSSRIELTTPITLEQWRELAIGCDELMVLNLPRTSVEDAELGLLTSLVSLRQLVLGSPVGDAGMATIADCPSLEIVNLPNATFTDAGLARLKQLPLLTLLRFGSPHVTDAGMEHLGEMPNLRFVHLIDVPITDSGLDPLKRVKLLESFYLDGSRCSEEGLTCLLQAHPGLHLHVNQLHVAGDEHAHEH